MKYMSGKRQTVTPVLKRLVKSLLKVWHPPPLSPPPIARIGACKTVETAHLFQSLNSPQLL